VNHPSRRYSPTIIEATAVTDVTIEHDIDTSVAISNRLPLRSKRPG
jgi:hypothetical protein